MDQNQILFSESRKFIIPEPKYISQNNQILALSAARNLNSLGFTLSKEAIEKLAILPKEKIVSVYNKLYSMCEKEVAADKLTNARIFYPNFPEEVMSMEDYELYLNAFIYYTGEYLFGVELRKVQEPVKRVPVIESFERELKVINLGTQKDFHELMKGRLFSAKTLPESKMEELLEYMKETSDWKKEIRVNKIPNKENQAKIALAICDMDYSDKTKEKILSNILRDAVDVLRFAALLSNRNLKNGVQNDAQLNGRVDFNLKSSEGRLVKNLLSKCKNLYTDIWFQKDLFKKLGRSISMKKQTPERLKKAYDALCANKKIDENGKRVYTPDGLINKAISSLETGDLNLIKKCAQNYPGKFADRFFEILTATNSIVIQKEICKLIGEIKDGIPIDKALKICNLADMRNDMEFRIVNTPKNGKWKALPMNDVKKVPEEIIPLIKENCKKAAINYVKGGKELGKTYISPALDNNKIPENNMRESSKGSASTFGSYIPTIAECNIIRPFIWWTNNDNKNSFDIDSSVIFMDKNLKPISNCYYGNLKAKVNNEIIGVHSGDWVNGGPVDGKGVAEYVDIDKEKAKAAGVRYVAFMINCYSAPNFSDVKNIKFGFMQVEGKLEDIRKETVSGNWAHKGPALIYDPKTVEVAIDLNTDTNMSTPALYDLEEERFIWIDKGINVSRTFGPININNLDGVTTSQCIIHRALNNYTPTMKQLFEIQAMANGEITLDITKADTIFIEKPTDFEGIELKENARVVTAYDLSAISSEFMTKPEEKRKIEKNKGKEEIKKSKSRKNREDDMIR